MKIQEAQALVEREIDENQHPYSKVECVILEDQTIERNWGWVFFYQSKAYVETGAFQDMLGGNAPFIVNKHDGSVVETGTAHDIHYYINEYEQSL